MLVEDRTEGDYQNDQHQQNKLKRLPDRVDHTERVDDVDVAVHVTLLFNVHLITVAVEFPATRMRHVQHVPAFQSHEDPVA